MLQEIIVFIILLFVLILVSFRIYKSIKKPTKSCNGCADSSCNGCPIDDLKKEIKNKKNKRN